MGDTINNIKNDHLGEDFQFKMVEEKDVHSSPPLRAQNHN